MPFHSDDDVVIITRDDTGCVMGGGGNPHYDVFEDATGVTNPHHDAALHLLPHKYAVTSDHFTKKVSSFVEGNYRVLELIVYRGGRFRSPGGRYHKERRRSPKR